MEIENTNFESSDKPPLNNLWKNMWRKKSLGKFEEEAATHADADGLRLSLFDLICIGVGGTVGTGVFVLSGEVLPIAGPSSILSWLIAGIICSLSAMSYMELSARIPTRGSCYSFAYHSLGELPAIIAAVCLTLEYGISSAGLARSWSIKVLSIIDHSKLTSYCLYSYDGGTADVHKGGADIYFNIPAGLIQFTAVIVCLSGLRFGKTMINSMSTTKVSLVMFMIITGLCAWQVDIFKSNEDFFPEGLTGTLRGASLLFFGFIGFDEVCCLARRSENPAYTMPRAIAATIIGTTVFSMLAQLSLSGMVPVHDEDDDDVHAATFETAFRDQGWSWAQWTTAIGEVILIPLVVLLSFLPQPELLAAMSDDGVIPPLFGEINQHGTYMKGTLLVGCLMTTSACFVPFIILWDMINLGVLFAFNLTNVSLLVVRYGLGGDTEVFMDKELENDHLKNHSTHHATSRIHKQRYFVKRCIFLIWAMGALGAYTFWGGYASLVLAKKDLSKPFTLISAIALLSFTSSVAVLSTRGNMVVEESDSKIFKSFGVPILPSIAILCNFFLMAQYGFWTHIYLILFMGISVIGYLFFRIQQN